MKTANYRRLSALCERHGPREFGKICQKLLALSFRACGCRHVVERGVQGVDIDAAWERDRYALEIKTTRGNQFHLAAKDIAGLLARRPDGYRPLVGVLQLRLLSEWVLVDASGLTVGNWRIDLVRPLRCLDLEAKIRPVFDAVLEEHFPGALRESQAYLNRALAPFPATESPVTGEMPKATGTTGRPGQNDLAFCLALRERPQSTLGDADGQLTE